ncbi:hypothetical protein [Burkholderia sp. BCC1970]|uniref:hypothetical protein n=1 Tax=Burkholderia sp. BCC1970 TaxID=2817437 RepID=UPI002ABE0AA5|nr:hypothetical protein [Burkholderia sp. BCC1970]
MQRVSGEIELKRVAGHLRDGIDLHASMPPPISSDGEQHRGKGCMEPANMCELAVTHLRCTERPLQEDDGQYRDERGENGRRRPCAAPGISAPMRTFRYRAPPENVHAVTQAGGPCALDE